MKGAVNPFLVSAISAAVEARRDELVELIQALVKIPSVTGDEQEIQRFVATKMREIGLEVEVWEPDPKDLKPYSEHVGDFDSFSRRPNVVGVRRGHGGGRSLILNAHIDTVESGDESRWTYPPFSGKVIDGRVYGRGSCDMKAGLATHLMAVLALNDIGLKLHGDLIVESVISEEDGGAGALASILHGYRADGAIITEPTNLAVVPAVGGSLVFRLHVSGRAAHACVRDEGVSAIEKFALVHRALIEFEMQRNAAIRHPRYAHIANKVPINIGVVRGGAWASSVPESLVAEGRAGLVPGEDLESFKRQFISIVDAAADADGWLRDNPPVVEWFSGQFAPAEIAAESPLMSVVAESHLAVTGEDVQEDAATYGSDMRHFLLFGNTPCLMYGAGDVRLAHYTNESISVNDVLTATKTVATAAAIWCGKT